jgi:hypothetical protein
MRSSLRSQATVSARAWRHLIRVWRRGRTLLPKSHYLLASIFLYASLLGNATAQVKFIQLSDPHLFDNKEEEGARNREILVDAVAKINELNNNENPYAFVVVTGDIGVEQIIKSGNPPELNDRIVGAAKTMANILASSRVRVWLFVPGNNDLEDEKDSTIDSYHRFIATLHDSLSLYHIDVIDLCPQSSPKAYIPPSAQAYAFIGFNNASFKNNNDASRLGERIEDCCEEPTKCSAPGKIRCVQRDEIQRVRKLVEEEKSKFTYIFYHIPEVDDPYLTTVEKDPPEDRKLHDFHQSRKMRKDLTGPEFVNSSWFVDAKLRKQWIDITKEGNVKGLFAGHLHVNTPGIYGKNANTRQLFICPPLAIKLQPIENGQARGFQEVSIDESASSGALAGEVSTSIYWYDQAIWSFSISPPTKHALEGEFMTWEKAAHISTVAQFFVVFVSVGFIWYQLRQQTKLARIANTQAQAALVSPFNLEIAQNEKMAKLWIISSEEWEKLSVENKEQYDSMLRWWFIFYENIFFQKESGLLDKSIFEGWLRDIDDFVEDQLVEKHWSKLNKAYHQTFVDYMNARIEEKMTKDDGSSS